MGLMPVPAGSECIDEVWHRLLIGFEADAFGNPEPVGQLGIGLIVDQTSNPGKCLNVGVNEIIATEAMFLE